MPDFWCLRDLTSPDFQYIGSFLNSQRIAKTLAALLIFPPASSILTIKKGQLQP